MDRDTPITSSGDGTVPRVNSNETLKVLYCYTQGIAVSLIAFFGMQRFISTLYHGYFWVYSALIASFKLIVDKALLQQAGTMLASSPYEYHAPVISTKQITDRSNIGASLFG